MVPQKTGVSSDFSRTLSHLQRINYSKAVNEDQVPVSQPKKGTAIGLLLATCCLPGIYGRVLWLQGHWLSRPVGDWAGLVESGVFVWRHYSASSVCSVGCLSAERRLPESWKLLIYTVYEMALWKLLCYQLLPGKVWLQQLESFHTQGWPLLPEGRNGGLEQSLFILIRHKVFIVGGYIILMLSVLKYKIFSSLPWNKNPSGPFLSQQPYFCFVSLV